MGLLLIRKGGFRIRRKPGLELFLLLCIITPSLKTAAAGAGAQVGATVLSPVDVDLDTQLFSGRVTWGQGTVGRVSIRVLGTGSPVAIIAPSTARVGETVSGARATEIPALMVERTVVIAERGALSGGTVSSLTMRVQEGAASAAFTVAFE